jgi:hypothetical protein
MYPETGFAVAKHQALGTKAANLAISNAGVSWSGVVAETKGNKLIK